MDYFPDSPVFSERNIARAITRLDTASSRARHMSSMKIAFIINDLTIGGAQRLFALAVERREVRLEDGDRIGEAARPVVVEGGPVGKTKRTSAQGVTDTRNNLAGFVVVQAESHQAAALMFEKHPHFSIFPGDAVEIMECLPIPGR